MKKTWYSADLREALRLAARYVNGMPDRDLDGEPFFALHGQGPGIPVVGIHALEIGIPHVTGRALDCLFNIESTLGERMDPQAEALYRRYFYSCMENDAHLPVYYRDGKPLVECHNLREACEGLAWLIRGRRDARSGRLADGFLSTLLAVTDERGYLSREKIDAAGLRDFFPGCGNAPSTVGRLAGALLNLYDAAGDKRAWLLAGRMAEGSLAFFGEDGELGEAAGTHIHSITSTLTGMLEYGYLSGQRELVDRVRAVYRHPLGLPQVMYSTGWVKEQIRVPGQRQGECNQIGDVIELQLLFGAHEPDAAFWYGEAEKFLRSALLPSQVLRDDFFPVQKNPAEDRYRDIRRRCIGGFGFPMPSAHLEHAGSALNTIDITQGAAQGICWFVRHIAVERADGIQINLFFDWENDAARVESALPLLGAVRITPKKGGRLRVRIPSALCEGSLRFERQGGAVSYREEDGYAVLEDCPAGAAVQMTFVPRDFHYSETYYPGTPEETVYEVYRHGEQVTAVTPVRGIYPLYEGWPLAIPELEKTVSGERRERVVCHEL